MMMTISIKEAEFFAYHGYYDTERLTGHTYLLSVDVTTEWSDTLEDLNDTVDYQVVYDICKMEMTTPRKLLENVVKNIKLRIEKNFPKVISGSIKLAKKQPQLGGKLDSTIVTVVW